MKMTVAINSETGIGEYVADPVVIIMADKLTPNMIG